MNTVEAVLFLVLLGYVFIIFATGQRSYEDEGNGFDKASGSKYFSNPDQHILFFGRGTFRVQSGPSSAIFASGQRFAWLVI
jgi:hypothetical protein